MSDTKVFLLKCTGQEMVLKNRHERREQEQLWMKYLWECAAEERKMYPYYSKSHSRGKSLLAMSTSPVGCDLELIRWERTKEDLERRMGFYLTRKEIEQVLASEVPQQTAILAWTRKESYFKVHQKRKVPDEFSLAQSDLLIQGAEMEFDSKILGNTMVATCYHRKNETVEWILI